jgi:hypothetical protein
MKTILGLFVGFSLFIGGALGAQEMPYHIPDVVTHQIKSTNVDQTFAIHVWQPMTKKDGSEKFPVLYITDANGGIAMAELIHLLHIGGDAPRFIVVGRLLSETGIPTELYQLPFAFRWWSSYLGLRTPLWSRVQL